MTTFALIHGASHASWHWYLVEAELRNHGHSTISVDLPCEDRLSGAAEYAEVTLRALAATDGDVVLVAHSLGGLTAPLVAAHRPVRRMVFIAGLLPVVGMSLNDQMAASDLEIILPGVAGVDGANGIDVTAAIEVFYPDAPRDLAEAAVRRLRRQRGRPFREVTPLQKWPDVPSAYLVCAADQVVNPAWARREVPGRLGIEPVEIQGDHSPFLARPAELAGLLMSLDAVPVSGMLD